jgi:hypothetical protein
MSDFQHQYEDRYMREVRPGLFHFVELQEWYDDPKNDTCCSLRIVDLSIVSDKARQEAYTNMGMEETYEEFVQKYGNVGVADACEMYGYVSNYRDWFGIYDRDEDKLKRKAFKASVKLELDERRYQQFLRKSANAIGSSNAEMMVGDIDSAMKRYEVVKEDHGGFMFGYLHGFSGTPAPQEPPDDKIAPAYRLGHKWGTEVREGQREDPGWVKTA